MRILDRAFNGAKEYYFADWYLQFSAGCARWFPEFTPVNLVALRFMFDLLKHFWRHDICCHINGSFPTYLAGLQTGYHRVSFFIALKESPLLNLLFQRGETQRDVFALGGFHFTLYQNLHHADVCRYVVRRGTSEFYFTFLGIDSLVECDTRSNIDFAHFIWDTVEAQYAFRRHAIALFPDRERFTIRLLCLRHYDVPSVGWTFSSGCTICEIATRPQVLPFTACQRAAGACHCNICARQPPSLKALAFNAYFTLVRNIERFELSRLVTYSQYRAACGSGRVDIEQLLPPEFPDINLLYTFTDSPTRPSHTDCSPGRAWLCASHRTFGSREEAVATLCAERHIYWCSVCDKALFFRVDCPFHGQDGDELA